MLLGFRVCYSILWYIRGLYTDNGKERGNHQGTIGSPKCSKEEKANKLLYKADPEEGSGLACLAVGDLDKQPMPNSGRKFSSNNKKYQESGHSASLHSVEVNGACTCC